MRPEEGLDAHRPRPSRAAYLLPTCRELPTSPLQGKKRFIGTGKTHLALALGLAAWQKGSRVRFTTAAAVVNDLLEARDDKRLCALKAMLRVQTPLVTQDVLIVDELGDVPLSKTSAERLFEIFSQRDEQASTRELDADGITTLQCGPRICPSTNGPRRIWRWRWGWRPGRKALGALHHRRRGGERPARGPG